MPGCVHAPAAGAVQVAGLPQDWLALADQALALLHISMWPLLFKCLTCQGVVDPEWLAWLACSVWQCMCMCCCGLAEAGRRMRSCTCKSLQNLVLLSTRLPDMMRDVWSWWCGVLQPQLHQSGPCRQTQIGDSCTICAAAAVARRTACSHCIQELLQHLHIQHADRPLYTVLCPSPGYTQYGGQAAPASHPGCCCCVQGCNMSQHMPDQSRKGSHVLELICI